MLPLLPLLLTLALFPLAINALRPVLSVRLEDVTRLRLTQAMSKATNVVLKTAARRSVIAAGALAAVVVIAFPVLPQLPVAQGLWFAGGVALACGFALGIAYAAAGALGRAIALCAEVLPVSGAGGLLLGARVGGGIILGAEAAALLAVMGAQYLPTAANGTDNGSLLMAGLATGAVLAALVYERGGLRVLSAAEAGRRHPLLNPGGDEFPERAEQPTLLLGLAGPPLAQGVGCVLEAFATSLSLYALIALALRDAPGPILSSALALPLLVRISALAGSGVLLVGLRNEGDGTAEGVVRLATLADAALSLLAAAGSTRWLLGPADWFVGFSAISVGILTQWALTWTALRGPEQRSGRSAPTSPLRPLAATSERATELATGLGLCFLCLSAGLYFAGGSANGSSYLLLMLVGFFAGTPMAIAAELASTIAESSLRLLHAAYRTDLLPRAPGGLPRAALRLARLGRGRQQWLTLLLGLSWVSLLPTPTHFALLSYAHPSAWLIAAGAPWGLAWLHTNRQQSLQSTYNATTAELDGHLRETTGGSGGPLKLPAGFRPRYMHYVDQAASADMGPALLHAVTLCTVPALVLVSIHRWLSPAVAVASALTFIGLTALICTVSARSVESSDYRPSSGGHPSAERQRSSPPSSDYLATHLGSASFSLTAKALMASTLLYFAVVAHLS